MLALINSRTSFEKNLIQLFSRAQENYFIVAFLITNSHVYSVQFMFILWIALDSHN